MKQHSKHFAVKTILITLFIQLTTVAVSIGQTKTEQIDKLMNLYSDYGQFNGSILVADAGKVIYKKGFGMANMEWNIP
ncbi:MAG: serine hydrolase, partial [bacterium]|nr:serine hydrolase [bacterium]